MDPLNLTLLHLDQHCRLDPHMPNQHVRVVPSLALRPSELTLVKLHIKLPKEVAHNEAGLKVRKVLADTSADAQAKRLGGVELVVFVARIAQPAFGLELLRVRKVVRVALGDPGGDGHGRSGGYEVAVDDIALALGRDDAVLVAGCW